MDSSLSQAVVTSAANNGISSAPTSIGAPASFGCHQAPTPSPVVSDGEDRSPTLPNFLARQIERIEERQRSTRGFALLAASILRNGISRQSQNGCGGGPTIEP